MSDDYGLMCLDCNSWHVQGNLRWRDAIELYKRRAALANLGQSLKWVNSETYTYVNISCDDSSNWEPGFSHAVKWIAEHPDHQIFIADEYGHTYTLLADGGLQENST